MAGKGWREMGGGKGVAGNGWRKRVLRNTSKFYKINNRSFKKNASHAPVGPLQAYRPTAGRLDPVGQLQADWA